MHDPFRALGQELNAVKETRDDRTKMTAPRSRRIGGPVQDESRDVGMQRAIADMLAITAADWAIIGAAYACSRRAEDGGAREVLRCEDPARTIHAGSYRAESYRAESETPLRPARELRVA
jgi:hypothetical protein